MQNTVVQFIVDNIFFFLPLGITGIVVTIILYITGKKDASQHHQEIQDKDEYFSKFYLNIFDILYLCISVTLIILGFLSDFFIPTLIGTIIVAIPFVLSFLFRYMALKRKVF